MDESVQKLVALGASAAVNCRPCLEHHLGDARRIGLSEDDIAAAVQVGLQVNQGAARQTRNFTEQLLGAPSPQEAATVGAGKPGGGPCC